MCLFQVSGSEDEGPERCPETAFRTSGPWTSVQESLPFRGIWGPVGCRFSGLGLGPPRMADVSAEEPTKSLTKLARGVHGEPSKSQTEKKIGASHIHESAASDIPESRTLLRYEGNEHHHTGLDNAGNNDPRDDDDDDADHADHADDDADDG